MQGPPVIRTPACTNLTQDAAFIQPRLPVEVIARIASQALDDDKNPYPCAILHGMNEVCDGCKFCMRERSRRLAPYRMLNRQVYDEVMRLVSPVLVIDSVNMVENTAKLTANVGARQGGLYHRLNRLVLDTDLEPWVDPLSKATQTAYCLSKLVVALMDCPNMTEIRVHNGGRRSHTLPLELSLVHNLPAPSLAQLTSFSFWRGGWWSTKWPTDGVSFLTLIASMPNLVELKLSGLPRLRVVGYSKLPPPPKTLRRLTLGPSYGVTDNGLHWLVGDGRGRPIPTLILDVSSEVGPNPSEYADEWWRYVQPLWLIIPRIRRLEVHDVPCLGLQFLLITEQQTESPRWPALESVYLRGQDVFCREATTEEYRPSLDVVHFLNLETPALRQVDFEMVVTRPDHLRSEPVLPVRTRALLSIPRRIVGKPIDANVNIAMVGYDDEQDAWENTPACRLFHRSDRDGIRAGAKHWDPQAAEQGTVDPEAILMGILTFENMWTLMHPTGHH